MPYRSLFSPLQLGAYRLSHRIVMAPLTRMRATQPGNVPGELNARYYAQRASAGGLLITEATQISQTGQGYPATPGIHSREQVGGWRLVSDAVHAKGAMIFLQLWHVGRISHRSYQPDGGLPLAPSPVKPAGQAFAATWERAPFETPREIRLEEIHSLVADYRKAARNGLAAGFDGVELHAANGYLLDQFLRDRTNWRNDRYGGSFENRARLVLEVLEAVGEVFGLDRVGIRLSPLGTFNDMRDSDPVGMFSYVLRKLAKKPIAYVHLIEARADERASNEGVVLDPGPAPTAALFRPFYPGVLIGAGGFSRESAAQAIATRTVDAVAFGKLFIANPDLPLRLKLHSALNPYDHSSFYGGTAKGYTDYPTLDEGLPCGEIGQRMIQRARFYGVGCRDGRRREERRCALRGERALESWWNASIHELSDRTRK